MADIARQPDRPTVYLHVGAPKTGTTFLQSVLWKNRHALRENGVLYPGEHFLTQTHAALDLLNKPFAGYENPEVRGTWRRVVGEARDWGGTVVISHEMLSPATPEQVDRALADLEFADVHVIYTARDLVRQVPAMWQQDLRNRDVQTFEVFVAGLRVPPEKRADAVFWSYQDAVDVLARWTRDLLPEHAHLITVPPPGAPRDTLWKRFCQVIGLDPEKYSTSRAAANDSLGVSEASLLRRINLSLDDEIRWPLYATNVNVLLGTEVLGGRPGSRKIVLSASDRAWVAERSRELVDRLSTTRYDIVGDLAELIPSDETAPPTSRPPGDTDADDAEMLDAAVECVAALVRRLQVRRDEFERLAAERDEVLADRERLLVVRDDLLADRKRLISEGDEMREILAKPATKLFVRRLSEKNRAVMRVRIIYWNIVEALRRLCRR